MDKTYYKACGLDELQNNLTVAAEVNGKSILLAKVKDDVYAIENNCTHENLPMGEREIVNREIQCPRHGARFDIKSGKATQIPGVIDLKTYDVKIKNNDVFVAVD